MKTKITFLGININEETNITSVKTQYATIRLKSNLVSNIIYDEDEGGKRLQSGLCDIPTWIAVQRGLLE